MNTTLLIIIGGCAIFLLGLVIFILILGGRKKKQRHLELEALLDRVAAKEADRRAWLIRFLVDRYAQEEQNAVELCEDFIAAEKQFLHAYMEQQLSQQPVTDFYEHISQLLDKYLTLLPDAAIVEPEAEDQQAAEAEQAATPETEETLEKLLPETEADLNFEPDLEVNVADAAVEFAEDPVTETETSGQTNEDVAEASSTALTEEAKLETEDDLDADWGEAFAEAGLEMKESSEKKE